MTNVFLTSTSHQGGSTVPPSIPDGEKPGCLVLDEKFVPQDNPDNLISRETQFWMTMIDSAGLIPLLFLVGVPGNMLSAAVFYKQGLKERINLCVFCLAVIDLLVITVTFLLTAEQVYSTFIGPSSFFIQYFVGLTGFTWVSMFLSALIASERCFCVVSPLRAQRVLSTRTMCVIIVITSTFLLTGMLVIAGPKHTMACVFDPKTNTTSQIVYVTEYYQKNKTILDLFDVFLYATALPTVFLVTIIVTTSITAAKLRSALRWRHRSSSASEVTTPEATTGDNPRDKREVALTKMLVATSVLFVVCLTPMLLVQVAMFLVPELKYGGRHHNLTALLWSVISVFRCINSSLNFFVYLKMGSRFRQTLRQLWPCKRVKTGVLGSDPNLASGKWDHGPGRKYTVPTVSQQVATRAQREPGKSPEV